MLQAIKQNTGSLSSQAAEKIVEYITKSDLYENNRLPNEETLAKMLNVSRSTVREAIKLLVSLNVLYVVRGHGTFVSEKPGIVSDPFGFSFVRDKRKLVFDLMEMRMIIEPKIADFAASRATASDIMQLEMLAMEVEAQILAGENHAQKDIELHVMIAHCSKNDVVSSIIPILNQSVHLFVEITKESLLQATIDGHREIVAAIKNHQPEVASEAMTHHLQMNKDELERAALNGVFDNV
jgi:DNA-binding FadR family transcriptional regulator